ncbi:MAG: hypothetical protein A4E65_00465 [Syntrophorhabdus sp. PtaU1.Bin153]|nr:MAG: hypothetical protein A4E65_00465 [Syntrophorhabdus sp. PtaU1.Bin153]
MDDFIINSAFVGGQSGADRAGSSGEGTAEAGSEDFLGILKNLMYGKNSGKNVADGMGGFVDPTWSERENTQSPLMASTGSRVADVMKTGVSEGGGDPLESKGDTKTAGQEKVIGIKVHYDQAVLADSRTFFATTTPTPDLAGDPGTSETESQDKEMGVSGSLKHLMAPGDSRTFFATTTPTPDVAGDEGTGQAQGQNKEKGMLESAASQVMYDQTKTTSHATGKEKDEVDSIGVNREDFARPSGQMPLNNIMALIADQASSDEETKTENEAIGGESRVPLSQDDLIKQSIGKNAEATGTLTGQGKQTENRNDTTGNDTGKGREQQSTFLQDRANVRNVTDSPFADEIEGDGIKAGDSGQLLETLMLRNAARKYGMFTEETGKTDDKRGAEQMDGLLKTSGQDMPQGDSLKTTITQAKEDTRVFEKGSFSSFVADRVEKVVEQYSTRNSSMDTVVRLKLDDKETLTVGLKHEGQNVVVEVKASNEGLANLLQSHKEDITRHLEDKNIFARMYVEADGENGYDRRNQQDSKREDGRKEGKTSFTTILETIA